MVKVSIKKLLGDPQAKTLKRVRKEVVKINQLADKYKKMSDLQLKEQTNILKSRLAKETLDDILVDAFALVREVADRTLHQRHYDVQLVGGIVLHEGNVAEMKTGEGKTLVATAPVYLNALEGKGVHVVTVNDYLAQRDAGWMASIYHFLGLQVGVIMPDHSFIYDPEYINENHTDYRMKHLKECSRLEAYSADVTYGTNNEFGFDYLRDNMVRQVEELRQRDLNFAIVDEVDSILIDEARTPLIISAPSVNSGTAYAQFAKIVKPLKKDVDFETDEKRKQVILTDAGVDRIEKALNIRNLYSSDNIRTIYHLQQALKAHALFKRDKDYVVTKDGEVVIVDEFTGRLLNGRRYNEGLHQAIEAKEGVEVQEESMTLASISFQNYFRLYKKLSGMTGTAMTESEEFHQIYKINVIEIPSNKPIVRIDRADRIYKTEEAKFRAIAKEVEVLHKKGQPVLLGTVSIEKNEKLSNLLRKSSIPHQILNAKNNESEALIVANAGEKGAVTLATNIAGRGTDIVLGDGVKELGGLFVLGSERHESRRIDNQLRGRSGRQGDPGMTQFFVSTEDDLMRIFGGERIGAIMERLGANDDTPIENKIISKSLEKAQERVEGFNFDQRRNVVQYDDVMNRHRQAIYAIRKEVLKSNNISKRIKIFMQEEVDAIVKSEDLLSNQLEEIVKEVFPFDDPVLDKIFDTTTDKFPTVLKIEAEELYKSRLETFGDQMMHIMEKDIYLQVLDELWMRHLENMDHLREGIHWMGVGQQDPLVEYRRQGQVLFDTFQAELRHQVVRTVLNSAPIDFGNLNQPIDTALTQAAKASTENATVILNNQDEFQEKDFIKSSSVNNPNQALSLKSTSQSKKTVSASERRKAHKKERKRKKVNNRRKK